MKTFLLVISLAASFFAQAQIGRINSVNVSTGLDFLLPTSTFANSYGAGPGVTVKGEYVFARHVAATVSGSFYRFSAKEATHLNLLPLVAGLRYYLGNFYVSSEAGYAFEVQNGQRKGIVYAFSAGDEIVTRRGGNSLDISLRIQAWNPETRFHFYGLRLAYEFRLR